MQETLHDHQTSISIAGRPIRSLRFADDIDHMGGSNGELQDFINRLINRATAYEMKSDSLIVHRGILACTAHGRTEKNHNGVYSVLFWAPLRSSLPTIERVSDF